MVCSFGNRNRRRWIRWSNRLRTDRFCLHPQRLQCCPSFLASCLRHPRWECLDCRRPSRPKCRGCGRSELERCRRCFLIQQNKGLVRGCQFGRKCVDRKKRRKRKALQWPGHSKTTLGGRSQTSSSGRSSDESSEHTSLLWCCFLRWHVQRCAYIR